MTQAAVAERRDQHARAYAHHRKYVLAVLARRCRWLGVDEREVALHDAWAVLLEKERSGALDVSRMRGPQVRAYLVQTALNKALDESRRAGRSQNEPLADEDLVAPTTPPEEQVASAQENARLREIVDELNPRQQTIVKLRFFFERSPDEVQRLLAITERTYRRELERAMRILAERYELVLAGRACERRASLISAYVAGIAGPNRTQDARAHLADCPACRRFAIDLRQGAEQVAGILPLPLLAVVGHGPWAPLSELAGASRDAIANAGAGTRKGLAAVSGRVDPAASPALTGARPGALAAAVAGCLAVSSGAATYCTVAGLPAPVAGLFHPGGRDPAAKALVRGTNASPRPQRTVGSSPITPRVPTATSSAPTRSSATVAAPARPAATRRAAARRVATRASAAAQSENVKAEELGLEGAGTPVASSAVAAGSAAKRSSGSSTPSIGSSYGSTPTNAAPGEFDP